MKRADLLLKIIAAAHGEFVTPVQMQKVAFLVRMQFMEQLPEDYYSFQKYAYGPFCVDIYHDAEALQRIGLISISINQRGRWKQYAATVAGMEESLDKIPVDIAQFIEETVDWARRLSFQELVRAIYQRYPTYRENSVFQGYD